MTPEEMLQHLVTQGKITQDDLQELSLSTSNNSFRTLVEGLHAILCDKDHDMAECKFHEETTMDGTWNRTCHQIWITYARELVLKSNSSPDELIDDLRRVSQVVNSIQNMTVGGKEVLNVLLEKASVQLGGQTPAIQHQNLREETS